MTLADLDDMAAMLGDPEVMTYYPAPMSRQDATRWIAWNQRNYAEHGHGLWIVETHRGEFVGDCGLTFQDVEGVQLLEIGYHVSAAWQGRGLATEAAAAVIEAAQAASAPRLVAIITPANIPSQRVAEKVGLRLERRAVKSAAEVLIFGANL